MRASSLKPNPSLPVPIDVGSYSALFQPRRSVVG